MKLRPLPKWRPRCCNGHHRGEVHLEAFDDITGIAQEKASIIDGLVPNGVAIMNADTPCTKVIETYTKDVTTRWFGAAADDASLSMSS